MTMTGIDMSEYIVTQGKYANNCSYFDSNLLESIIKHIFVVISIAQKVKL